jgi:hypothetical protein
MWKGKRVRINLADYDQVVHGEIIETIHPARRPDNPPVPMKDPRVDADGSPICMKASPMHRA